jgi:prophage tail gpP-like protein
MFQDVKIIITKRNGEMVSDNNQYSSYSFDMQYGVVASAFSLVLIDLDADIQTGYGIQFLVNNRVYFRGIIQRKNKIVNKNQRGIQLSGKDRASILVESYCNNFKDFNDHDQSDIIETLIAQTNFYTKVKGTIDESTDTTGFNLAADITDRNAAVLSDVNESDTASSRNDVTSYDAEFTALANKKHFKIEIGDKVFSKIHELVDAAGYEILYQENGTLYIGDLNKKRYADTVVYNIVNRKDGKGNNVLSATENDDISGRYSTISVTSQSEGKAFDSGSHVNKESIATDSTLPGKKYFAQHINSDEGDPEKIAIMTRENQRIAGYTVTYEVPGHVADNGHVWTINRYVNVYDDIIDVYRHLVLYGRTFIFDQNAGSKTILRLSHEKL